MKTVEQVRAEFLATLCELENTQPEPSLKKYLQDKLVILGDVLEDDYPSEYHKNVQKVLDD